MSAIKRGIGTFAGVYAAMIVILWPSIRVDLQPDTRASKLIVIEFLMECVQQLRSPSPAPA